MNSASITFLCTYAIHENSSILEWNFWIVEHENVQDYKRVPNCYLKWLNQFIAPPARQVSPPPQFSRFLSVLCPMWHNSYEHFWIWIPDVGSGTFQKLAALPKLSFLTCKVRGNTWVQYLLSSGHFGTLLALWTCSIPQQSSTLTLPCEANPTLLCCCWGHTKSPAYEQVLPWEPIVVVQALSRVSVTPRTAARQACPSFTVSRSLLKLVCTELVLPSKPLILFCPLLLPSIFPSTGIISNESALRIRWPKYWSFS